MAILTKQQLLEAVQGKLTDSDDDLTILENITDTLNSFENKNTENEDWKKKFEENDKAWRERYKARFSEPTHTTPEVEQHLPEVEVNEPKSANITIEDLFKD